mgnify:CR=1 FL=1|jgi:hypothetical protein
MTFERNPADADAATSMEISPFRMMAAVPPCKGACCPMHTTGSSVILFIQTKWNFIS